jgi:hypothetical protein
VLLLLLSCLIVSGKMSSFESYSPTKYSAWMSTLDLKSVISIVNKCIPWPCNLHLLFFFFQGWGLNFRFLLAKQVLYHWNHTSTLFCCGYFGDRVSLFAWAGLDWVLLFYTSHHHWGYRNIPAHADFFHWDGVL